MRWKRAHVPEAAVLEACEEPGRALRYLRNQFGAPWKVVHAALIREDNRGHLEVGVSLATAWLTPKGRQRLAEIRESARIRRDLEYWPAPESLEEKV